MKSTFIRRMVYGSVVMVALICLMALGHAGGQGVGTNNGIHGAFNGNVYVNAPYMLALPAQSFTSAGTLVSTGTCQAQTTVTVAGVTTSSVVTNWSVATALPATWQTGIDVLFAVSANTVTPYLCNSTAGSITPAATLVNFRVVN